MAKIRRFHEPKFGREAEQRAKTGDLSSSRQIAGEARFCAYNTTRERFLSNQVQVGSFSSDLLEQSLANITPKSSAALWVNPSRELPLTLFRFPVDMIHLDKSGVVLDTIESFPISTQSSPMELAASLLVLPARTITAMGIEHGDQLILCSSDEMESRLAQLQSKHVQLSTGPEIIQNRSVASFARFSVHEDLTDKGSSNSLKPQETLNQVSQEVTSRAEQTTIEVPASAEMNSAQEQGQRSTNYLNKRSWWRRFLAGEPPDKRLAERESIPGLVAYFFNGAAPIAHQVLDMSTSGVYVLTEDRWYPNTLVRLTLSDQRDESREVSITLFARVARAGKDGVGMQFGLVRKKDLNQLKTSEIDDQALIVTKEQIEDFVRRFKASS